MRACRHKCEENGGTDKCSDNLEQHVHQGFFERHSSRECYSKCDGRIDVASGDTSDSVSHGHDCKTESQSDS